MKKKLLALFMTLAVAVCMVPTFAFADEAAPEAEAVQEPTTTEQPVATEQPTETEQSEAQAPAETSTTDEKAEAPATEESQQPQQEQENITTTESNLSTQTISIDVQWKGYTVKIIDKDNYFENGFVAKVYDYKDGSAKKTIEFVANQVINLKDIVESMVNKGSICLVDIEENIPPGSIETTKMESFSTAMFMGYNTEVKVKGKAAKNTTFEYGIDSIIVGKLDEQSGKYVYSLSKTLPNLDEGTTKEVELVGNTITLKKGESSAIGNLIMRSNENRVAFDGWGYMTAGFFFKEKSNDGGYDTDTSIWGTVNRSMFKLDFGDYTGVDMGYAKFKDIAEIQANLNAVNSLGSIQAQFNAFLSKFTEKVMVFEHGKAKSNKDGAVATGDSMNLALFGGMAIMALIGAAAVFATRREQ